MELNQDNMLAALREGECEVTFTKVNGDTRVMKCTLNMDIIPRAKMPKGDNVPELREGLDSILKAIRVFDTGLEDWRSFKVETVKNFQKV
jgi:hypothetical protein